jgi:peptide/nickel transport system ATP-binding protein
VAVAASHLRASEDVLLSVEDLVVEFPGHHGDPTVKAVSQVSFDLLAGETLGLVGESGCGKSSVARAIMQLPRPTSGHVVLDGTDLTRLHGGALRGVRSRIQMIFQDPISSLNPRRTIAEILSEPAIVWRKLRGGALRTLVDDSLDAVGLDPATTRDRRPTQFSGGQCQRVCIARALILDPEVIICDEPVSSLDVSIQAQILNLLEDLRDSRDLTMLFISHDLAVVKNVSDRIAVMYLGKLCEVAPAEDLYRRPAHPYTAALVGAIPDPNPRARPRRLALVGDLPSAADPPSGCRFRTRCPRAQEVCVHQEPPLEPTSDGHFVACHFPLTSEPRSTAGSEPA